jgi:hypothetical protein
VKSSKEPEGNLCLGGSQRLTGDMFGTLEQQSAIQMNYCLHTHGLGTARCSSKNLYIHEIFKLAVGYSCKREIWANTSSIGARHLIDSCKDRNKSANQKEAVDEKVEEASQGQLTGILFNPERKLKSIAC